jgi:dipeptidyl aminopeptidase/acylaminoacyl peptidase
MNYAPKCKTPALFIHGIDDDFVDKSHSERNYTEYGGPKELAYCEGNHNDERPDDTLE